MFYLRILSTLSFVIDLQLLIYVNCFNFDAKNVDIITRDEEYFGYSLMLQKGRPSMVLVGAPKANSSKQPTLTKPGVVFSCNLETKNCRDYSLKTQDVFLIENGQMLGATLDGSNVSGESFVACAPRAIQYQRTNGELFYYSNGLCYKVKNSLNFANTPETLSPLSLPSKQITTYNSKPQYYYAFGEIGTSIQYNQENAEFLFGSPGMLSWIGSVLRYQESNLSLPVSSYRTKYQNSDWTIPNPVYSSVLKRETGTLFGYSVSSGMFRRGSNEIWYVAGAPRAENINGIVLLFTLEDRSESSLTEQEVLIGKQVGSYFGSSVLATDVTNDNAADLFVGAPLFSSYTWDEGCVYFYKNKGNGTFESPVEIMGSSQRGSRFGTTIVDIGDVDRNGYKDIAISAPYENDGTGAIYIYSGGEHFKPKYSQRISPETFSLNIPVRGFGFSISKGVDIDNNLHNDIAVGAYKSQQVFIIKSCNVIQLQPKLTSNVSEIIFNTSHIMINACIGFYTVDVNVAEIEVKIQVDVGDDRIFTYNNFQKNVFLQENKQSCEEIVINLKPSSSDYTKPLIVNFMYSQVTAFAKEFQPSCAVTNPNDDTVTSISIPFAHGCGSDQICQTDLVITAAIENINRLVVGTVETMTISINLFNKGDEPAYLCYVYLVLPEGVEIEQLNSRCIVQNKVLKCLVENRLGPKQNKIQTYDLDVRRLDLRIKELFFHMEANSTGEELNTADNTYNFSISIDIKVSPHISGKSIPEQIAYVNEEGNVDKELLTFTQEFQIINSGPSPLDIRVDFALPIKINNNEFVQIYKPTGHINNELVLQCSTNYPSSFHPESQSIARQTAEIYEVEKNLLNNDEEEMSDIAIKTPLNRTININCRYKGITCINIACFGGRLYKSSHTAVFSFNLQINTSTLANLFAQELLTKDIIVYTSDAKVYTSHNAIKGHVQTVLYGELRTEGIKVWVIVLAAVAGLFCLSLTIFILYKFNFFQRSLREKLLNEATSEEINLDSANYTDENL